ncbi:hypothetical protein CAEBREN_22117 [Caenorhabditis brenneri]|uniref:Uncharacterized protein n=1 Tax=Caenorhabditis brenneri TaxID=135651 RepID=G0N199_CAEBE|nr:hypothetical protein CAEBREN_22117 [Caenorhabditis brenneri]
MNQYHDLHNVNHYAPPPQNYAQHQFQDFGGWYNYQPQVVEVHHVHFNYHYHYDMGAHLENLPDAHHHGQPQDLQQQPEPQQPEPQQWEPQQWEPQQWEPQQWEPQQPEPQQWDPLDVMEMELDFYTDDEMDSDEEMDSEEEETDGAEEEEDQV